MNARSLPLLVASLVLAACGNTIVYGGGSGDVDQDTTTATAGGGGSTGEGGSTGSSSSEPQVPAVALTRAQNDIIWEEYWESHDPSGGSTSSGGSQNLDPNDLFLHLSDLGVSCGSPTVDLPCGGHHELTLVLPPAFQQVGEYDLEDLQLVAYSIMSESGTLNSPDPEDCPRAWGGGSLGSGTLKIISIDQTEVRFRVKLTSGLWESDPSGEYTAPRCPTSN